MNRPGEKRFPRLLSPRYAVFGNGIHDEIHRLDLDLRYQRPGIAPPGLGHGEVSDGRCAIRILGGDRSVGATGLAGRDPRFIGGDAKLPYRFIDRSNHCSVSAGFASGPAMDEAKAEFERMADAGARHAAGDRTVDLGSEPRWFGPLRREASAS